MARLNVYVFDEMIPPELSERPVNPALIIAELQSAVKSRAVGLSDRMSLGDKTPATAKEYRAWLALARSLSNPLRLARRLFGSD